MSIHCPRCGHQISEDSTFCGVCGNSIPAPVTAPAATPSHESHEIDTDIDLSKPAFKELLIGRSPACHLLIDEPSVSEQHAALVRNGDELYVKDLGSSNGTYVDGRKVSRARVTRGNKVRFGASRLEWDDPKLAPFTDGVSDSPLPVDQTPEPPFDVVEPPADPLLPASPRPPAAVEPPKYHLDTWPTKTVDAVGGAKPKASSPKTENRRDDGRGRGRGPKFFALLVVIAALLAGLIIAAWLILPRVLDSAEPLDAGVAALTSGASLGSENVVEDAPTTPTTTPAAHPSSASSTDEPAAPLFIPGDENTPLFRAERPHLSGELFAKRVAEQVDPRPLASLVAAQRVRLQTTVSCPALSAELLSREEWATPLGREKLSYGPAEAILTTRSVLDYRFPAKAPVESIANLALFAPFPIAGAPEQKVRVFRLARPALPGVAKTRDFRQAGAPEPHRPWNDAAIVRYFDELVAGRVASGEARLLEGDWSEPSGLDLAILYFHISDPAASAFRPRGALDVDEARRLLGLCLEAAPEGWRRRLRYLPPTPSPASNGAAPTTPNDGYEARVALTVNAAALSRLRPLLSDEASDEALRSIANLLMTSARSQGGPSRTLTVIDDLPTAYRGAEWNGDGQLLIRYQTEAAEIRTPLAGVWRVALDDERASRVVATVDALARAESARLAVSGSETHPGTATLLVPNASFDVGAELLRRGLTRLHFADRSLRYQPSLLRVADAALRDARTRSQPPIADAEYRAALEALLPR